MRRALPFAALLMASSCAPGVHRVTFDEPEAHVTAGRTGEAIASYAKLAKELLERGARDAVDEQALARLYRRLFDLRAPEYAAEHPEILARAAALLPGLNDATGASLLTLSLRHDIEVLTGPATPEARQESLLRAADTLEMKADRPELRKSSLQDAGPLHTLVLLEAAASFEHAFLRTVPTANRSRLGRIYARLGALADGIVASSATKPAFGPVWSRRAADLKDRAVGAERDAQLAPLPEDLQKVADYTLARHLQEAIRWSDRGTQVVTERGKGEEIERCYRASLRHFALAREAILKPDLTEDSALSTIPIVIKFWRDLMGW